MENKYCVYCHKLFDGRRYIGITKRKPNQRWKNGKGYEYNTYFYNAIKKYGWNSFEHLILFENLNEKDACEKEIELIKEYKTQDYRFGFNCSAGGEGLYMPNDKTREKMRKAHIGQKPYWLGKHRSLETRIKLSNANKGKKQSKELIEKRIRKIRGSKWKNERLEKMSYKVDRFDDKGNYIATFPSIKNAEKELHISHKSISKSIKQNIVVSGNLWKLSQESIRQMTM